MVVMLLGSSMYAYALNYCMTYLVRRRINLFYSQDGASPNQPINYTHPNKNYPTTDPPNQQNQSILRASNIIGDRMDAVNSFAQYRQLPPRLRATIHEYFMKVNASFRSKEDLQNERDVLALMAPWLRDDVITTINRGIVRSVPIFDRIIRSHAHAGGGGGGGQELLQHLVDVMCAKVCLDE